MSTHNRRYKDSVFVDFFGEDKKAKENFLSLYNALHATHNNMPIRFLEYAARLYEQIQNPRERYLRKLKPIPTPEFYVFYNGKEKYPAHKILKLSDAFITKPAKASLELVVQVLNINYNKDNGILEQCKPLEQYTLFVEAVRRHSVIDRENGFKNAIKECIQNDILKDYLREEERQIAFAEGEAQGFSDGSRKKALETAKILSTMHLSCADIAKATGLSEDEIKQL